jgi:hypothetical protein
MPVFFIVGAMVGLVIWGGLLAALLKFIFKRSDKRLLNGIALAIVIILPTLSLGIDDAFVANLIAANLVSVDLPRSPFLEARGQVVN